MRKLKVFYRPEMAADSHGYSPSARKPELVTQDWLARGEPVEIVSEFLPLDRHDLALAHDRDYVRDILEGRTKNGHGNKRLEIAESCRWTGGSMVAAAIAAVRHQGVTCSPTSGFHHAHFDHNHGFCTFNSLVIAARTVSVFTESRVGILDFDYHYGDGTEDIIDRLELDIEHVTGVGEEAIDRKWVEQTIADMGVDLILYQAGADQHIDDPLGGLFTTEELALRDRIVFESCVEQNIAVCWNLAGGYQVDPDGGISEVLNIHRNTLHACMAAYSGINNFRGG